MIINIKSKNHLITISMDSLSDYANELDDLITSIDRSIKKRVEIDFIKSRIVRCKQVITSFRVARL